MGKKDGIAPYILIIFIFQNEGPIRPDTKDISMILRRFTFCFFIFR
ncbi:hypothetical protein AAJ76_3100042857 [Vairimorpha ceranae]|uniref:Uncharacterized protein n=1 Tax=Vairimorpha ceranae TaxID=40302 RepID=A0A0F9YRD2_9MICR|nr:hypothetical protein AAJ76_3100042857 [Vairimorpha ceranae]KKO75137.1 hypothetical protein AAJ76_3100042857 [Vairimorpha ceranae]